MNSPDDPLLALARRLKRLREDGLAGKNITQRQLARALSRWEPTSSTLITSWESTRDPIVPPANRLEACASSFATERSVAIDPYRVLELSELNEDEGRRREEILAELLELRESAVAYAEPTFVPNDFIPSNLWHFPEDQDVTIICAELPNELRQNLPYANPASPDYMKLYRFTDLDALLEIHGYIRSVNPTTHVNVSTPAESLSDLFVPVRQEARSVKGDIDGSAPWVLSER